jgi:hypothetical protein
MTLAHQALHQLEPDVQHAVLGNVGTLVAFRMGPEDAAFLAKEFQRRFAEEDLLGLPNRHVIVRLMIDGAPSQALSAVSIVHPASRAQPHG